MRRAFAWTLLLCLAPLSAGCAMESKTEPAPIQHIGTQNMNKDQADVQNTIEGMTSAFEKNDIDAVMATYEPGAAILFEPGQPVTDVQQARQMFDGMAAAKPTFTYSGHEVVVSGDTAIHIAPWQMTAHMPDGQEIKQAGLSIAVLRRQADGSWKMVIDNPHGSRLMEQSK
ncbi:YybH family protein [Gimibacter soli]|uniref:DUF4440 domain-containing protein n=1 Tax=Gimibacter soli TaxID=3024400 RepID=A0AAE9XWB3_9PROT|nr:DUF4440 domain-containing protein [Gimibacter soli]WCL55593.1 DUF4440 domain-containing protein [Gimibacter soli]